MPPLPGSAVVRAMEEASLGGQAYLIRTMWQGLWGVSSLNSPMQWAGPFGSATVDDNSGHNFEGGICQQSVRGYSLKIRGLGDSRSRLAYDIEGLGLAH